MTADAIGVSAHAKSECGLKTSQNAPRLKPRCEPVLALLQSGAQVKGFSRNKIGCSAKLQQSDSLPELIMKIGARQYSRASRPLHDGTGSVLADEAVNRSRIHRV